METNETTYPQSGSFIDQAELKSFYKSSLPQILKSVFGEPINGTYRIFADQSGKTYFQSLVLMASTFVLYVILTYLLTGSQLREIIGFGGAVKAGLGAVIFMLVVSVVVFGLKAVSGGKPQFKNELMTGGLCSIPLIILLLLAFVAKMFAGEEAMSALTIDPTSIIAKAGIMLLLMFYVLLMLINIVMQSLRASGTKDGWAWYMSPAVIFLSAYLSFKIAVGVL